MASEGCGAFSTLPLSPPFSFAFQTLASYILLPSSAFPVSPFLLILVSSVVIFPFLSAFVRLSSRRSLRKLCGQLSLFYTATIKKQGKGFWYETQKMQLDTDLRRYFKDLNKNIYSPFGWYLNFLYLSSAGSIVHYWSEMFGIVHGLCWLKTRSPVKPCGSIVRLITHDEVCKIEPAQAGRMG